MESWHRALNPPVSILFDFGGIYEGWCYDFGRTVFFGEPDEEAQRVYDVMMASQAAGIAALKAGEATTSDADAAARKVIEDAPAMARPSGIGWGTASAWMCMSRLS